MANVVIRLGNTYVKAGIGTDAKLFTWRRLDPFLGPGKSVFTAPGDTFHDFRCASIKGQGGGQDHAN